MLKAQVLKEGGREKKESKGCVLAGLRVALTGQGRKEES